MPRSHVFVAQADLHHLACDAWLLPTDAEGHFTQPWYQAADEPRRAWMRTLGRLGATCRVAPAASDDPIAIATSVAVGRRRGPEAFVPPVVAFVECAVGETRARRSLRGRERPLLALPVVGTGHGGGADVAGEVLRTLMPQLLRLAEQHQVDIALVARDRAMHAAAQRARLATPDAFGALLPRLDGDARRLAGEARAGRLVLFLGAGVSVGAGLPAWTALLRQLGAAAGVPWEGGLADLGPLEQGEVLTRRFEESGSSVGVEVARILSPFQRHALAHALLAALPVREIITQNYDVLFETASDAIDGTHGLGVLPFAPDPKALRWLLKMHGTVDEPDSIVLSRTDYLRYAEERGALMGIVQAMLLTRHMLFVGFSLNDPNFHRVADSVRRAAAPARRARGSGAADLSHGELGTVLTLKGHSLGASVWPEVQWVDTSEGEASASARQLDILLDAVGAHAVGAAPLLEERFASLQTPEEVALVAPLRELAKLHANRTEASAVWQAIGHLLKELGDA